MACEGKCEWDSQGNLIHFPCGDNCGCRKPFATAQPDTDNGVYYTNCSSSSSGSFAIHRSTPYPHVVAGVRLPRLDRAGSWAEFDVPIPEEEQVFELRVDAVGWRIVFFRIPTPQTASVTPPVLPTLKSSNLGTALAASVVLPEQSGYQQYWVTVLDEFRYAVLQSAEWGVVFVQTMDPPEGDDGEAG